MGKKSTEDLTTGKIWIILLILWKNFINQAELFNLLADNNKSLNEMKEELQKSPKTMDPPVEAAKLKTQYDELNNKLTKIYTDAENQQKAEEKKLKDEQEKIEKEKREKLYLEKLVKENAEKKAKEDAEK